MTPPKLPRRTALGLAIAALAPAGLSGCTVGGESNAAAEAKDQGYRSGDGSITTVEPADRKASVTLAGRTLRGKAFDVADHEGTVMVVNMWVSSCGPCHKEAPDLVETYNNFSEANEPVDFIGVDYRESSEDTGRSQSKSWKLPYDSVFDPTGKAAVQMQGVLSAQPSTAVLDRKGRVAAVVLGAVTGSTLRGLVEDVLAEA